MIIRPATEADLDVMLRLTSDALSFASSPRPYEWEGAKGEAAKRLLRMFLTPKSGAALVLEVEAQVVGFVACRFDELDPNDPDKAAVVELLAVSPEHRGRGLGTHLVEELKQTLPAQGVTRLDVDVSGTNDPALRFWRRAGFREIAVTMSIDLAGPPTAGEG